MCLFYFRADAIVSGVSSQLDIGGDDVYLYRNTIVGGDHNYIEVGANEAVVTDNALVSGTYNAINVDGDAAHVYRSESRSRCHRCCLRHSRRADTLSGGDRNELYVQGMDSRVTDSWLPTSQRSCFTAVL